MEQAFANLIKNTPLLLIDFYAEWCGPCHAMKPILESVKSKIGDHAKIIKIDIDKAPGAAMAYQIQSVPTLLLLKFGQIIWRHSGVVPESHILQIVHQNM